MPNGTVGAYALSGLELPSQALAQRRCLVTGAPPTRFCKIVVVLARRSDGVIPKRWRNVRLKYDRSLKPHLKAMSTIFLPLF